MPNFDDHILKAGHNGNFFKSLDQNIFPDWVVNGIFYSALHCVDAVLSKSNLHPPLHHLRGAYIQKNSLLQSIYINYRSLEDLSRDARYTNKILTQVEIKECLDDLKIITEHISKFLKISIQI